VSSPSLRPEERNAPGVRPAGRPGRHAKETSRRAPASVIPAQRRGDEVVAARPEMLPRSAFGRLRWTSGQLLVAGLLIWFVTGVVAGLVDEAGWGSVVIISAIGSIVGAVVLVLGLVAKGRELHSRR
jgi:hypothetical protein